MGFWIWFFAFIALFLYLGYRNSNSPAAKEAAVRKAEAERRIVCQFCQQAGHVTTHMEQRKHGVSGGKATAGLLTGGVSLLAVGLSRKGWVTILSCGNCGMKWQVTP